MRRPWLLTRKRPLPDKAGILFLDFPGSAAARNKRLLFMSCPAVVPCHCSPNG